MSDSEMDIPAELDFRKLKKFDRLLGKIPVKKDQRVVTRFPPEPSGYLHLGHLKAMYISYALAKKHGGQFVVRMDDTNPANISQVYEMAILQDLEQIGVKPDALVHTSRHFERIKEAAQKLIEHDLAYCDETPGEEIKRLRNEGVATPARGRKIEENLELWKQMLAGERNDCCLRLKLVVDHKNKVMRDPVIFRHSKISDEAENQRAIALGYDARYQDHIYPTYDFACPLIDSWDGITHAFRSSEYCDRNELYHWVLEVFQMRPICLIEFSRLSLPATVLSKRKMRYLVEQGVVDDWDDPRMPTLRGLFNRGMTVSAMIKFVAEQGISKSYGVAKPEKLLAFNKQALDLIVPRYTAIEQDCPVILHLSSVVREQAPLELPKHPKFPTFGKKKIGAIWRSGQSGEVDPEGDSVDLMIEQDDAQWLKEGDEITLLSWGNVIINRIEEDEARILEIWATHHPEGDFKQTEWKLTWLPLVRDEELDPENPQAELIRTMVTDPESGRVLSLKSGTIYRFGDVLTVDEVPDDKDWKDYLNRDSLQKIQIWMEPEVELEGLGAQIQFQRKGFYRRRRVLNESIWHENFRFIPKKMLQDNSD